MNKSKNSKLKDFLYDATDHILVIGILLLVVIVVFWKVNSLFSKNYATNLPNSSVSSDNNGTTSNNSTNENSNDIAENISTIKIEIPENALPPTIANILLDSGLIEDNLIFLQTLKDMQLDTKLRSGTYEFDENATMKDIINKLAHVNE